MKKIEMNVLRSLKPANRTYSIQQCKTSDEALYPRKMGGNVTYSNKKNSPRIDTLTGVLLQSDISSNT